MNNCDSYEQDYLNKFEFIIKRGYMKNKIK